MEIKHTRTPKVEKLLLEAAGRGWGYRRCAYWANIKPSTLRNWITAGLDSDPAHEKFAKTFAKARLAPAAVAFDKLMNIVKTASKASDVVAAAKLAMDILPSDIDNYDNKDGADALRKAIVEAPILFEELAETEDTDEDEDDDN